MYLEYSESTWQLVAMAKSDQLGTSERLQEKIEKIKQSVRDTPVSSDDGAEVQGLRDALSVSQTRERELHQQLERERERAKVKEPIMNLMCLMKHISSVYPFMVSIGLALTTLYSDSINTNLQSIAPAARSM